MTEAGEWGERPQECLLPLALLLCKSGIREIESLGEDIMVIDSFYFCCCLYQGEAEKEPQETHLRPGLWFLTRPLLV